MRYTLSELYLLYFQCKYFFKKINFVLCANLIVLQKKNIKICGSVNAGYKKLF